MQGLPRPVARRWYAAGVALSLLAIVFAVVSNVFPKVGYSFGFLFTMAGAFAVCRPSWARSEARSRFRLTIVGSGVLVCQAAILYAGLSATA